MSTYEDGTLRESPTHRVGVVQTLHLSPGLASIGRDGDALVATDKQA
jgi:hypothetical protein